MSTYCKPDSIIPLNDEERLKKLNKYKILDTPPEQSFDKVALLAAQIFDAPGAFVAFVDRSRVFFKANINSSGLINVLREDSLCSLVILSTETTTFNDTHQIPEIADNPGVAEGGIRFYAGAPLKTSDGYLLGAVCVTDTVPRSVTEKQVKMLETLSSVVMDELELRLATRNVVRVQTDLMNMVVHDLKNPLTSIIIYSKLIDQRTTESNIKMMAGRVVSSTEHILNTLNELLDLSQIEDGRLTLKFEEVNIIDLLEKVISDIQILATQKEQIINLYHNHPIYVEIDKLRMQEVFENLLSNAIKYSYNNKEIGVFIHEEESNVIIEFRDEGQGLTEEDMHMLFNKFAKLSAIPTNKERSNGLGLSIAKTLVELHNGKIWASSEGKDKGASFFVSIAVKK